jgi:hypothetical protein
MKKILSLTAAFKIDQAIHEGLQSFSKEAGYTLSVTNKTVKKTENRNGGKLKALFILLVSTIIVIAACAQTSVGVKAGINRYALTGDDKSYITRFHAGGMANIKVSKLFAVQPEVLFSKEGNDFEEDDVVIGTYLNYVSIPIMAQLQTKPGFYVEAGPGFAFLITATYKETDAPDENIKDFYKANNLFFGAGAGYRSKIGLGIGIRYNFGLANIAVNGAEETKTTGGHISIVYLFKTKRK